MVQTQNRQCLHSAMASEVCYVREKETNILKEVAGDNATKMLSDCKSRPLTSLHVAPPRIPKSLAGLGAKCFKQTKSSSAAVIIAFSSPSTIFENQYFKFQRF